MALYVHLCFLPGCLRRGIILLLVAPLSLLSWTTRFVWGRVFDIWQLLRILWIFSLLTWSQSLMKTTLQFPSSQCFGYRLLGSVDCFARTNKVQLDFAILFIVLFSPFGRKSKASSFASFLGWRFSFSTSDYLLLCSRKLSFLLLGCHVSTCKIYCARPLYRKFTTPSNALTNLDPGGYRGVNFLNLAFYGHLRQR